MPKQPTRWEEIEIHQKAFLAFAAELPLLCDPPSFQLYMSCISQGASIGAIDPVDVGRFCHIAQTAMSAWKLANLIVPAAQMKEEREQKKAEARSNRGVPTDRSSSVGWSSTPLPPEGNQQDGQPISKELQYAIDQLPSWETQKQHFKALRKRGVALPSDEELRDNPFAALYFCQTAEWFSRKDAEAAPRPKTPQPAQGEKPATPAPPLPPKGNQPEAEALPYDDWENLYALTKLPDWETQTELFKLLRDRGTELPTDEELRNTPADALRHCQTARYYQKAQQQNQPKEQPTGKKQPPAKAA